MRVIRLFAVVLASVIGISAAQAGPILWIDDSGGNIGKVDVATGAVTLVGNAGVVLTDIAFDPTGNLYGISFSDLYSIDQTTGAASLIGGFGGASLNSLTFGADGTLYAASNTTTNIYSLSTATGAATLLGDTGFSSAGDLAFHGGSLYLTSGSDQLVEISLATFTGTAVGALGFSSVFGLANGDNNVLYGVSGTQILSVDVATGAGTLVEDYSGQGLGVANGSAFFREAVAVPEPSTLISAGLASLLGLGYLGRRRRSV